MQRDRESARKRDKEAKVKVNIKANYKNRGKMQWRKKR